MLCGYIRVVSRPKRHHFVPRSYLARFGRDGSVLVRWRGRKDLVATSTANIAVETGFYDVVGPDARRSTVVEERLAGLEGEAMKAIRAADQALALPGPNSADRVALATFLATQMTRTPEQRERVMFPRRVATFAADREIDRDLIARYLCEVHLGFPPQPSEVQAALDYVHVALRDPEAITKDLSIQLMLASVEKLVPVILNLHWNLEIARKPRLVTSDAPLLVWRRPTPRDRFEGIGLANAEEVRFPLDPGKQLVLTQNPRPETVTRIEPGRVRACNDDIARGCHRFVVGHPDRRRQLQQVDLPAKRPIVRFNTGPLYEPGPDGTNLYKGEMLHMWVPRR